MAASIREEATVGPCKALNRDGVLLMNMVLWLNNKRGACETLDSDGM